MTELLGLPDPVTTRIQFVTTGILGFRYCLE